MEDLNVEIFEFLISLFPLQIVSVRTTHSTNSRTIVEQLASVLHTISVANNSLLGAIFVDNVLINLDNIIPTD
ncbi:hypothetical protein PGB90_000732 [Kerria lacca]